jgi:hypothetical protein
VINVPVLKSHGGYGVTASVKHYMGVASDNSVERGETGPTILWDRVEWELRWLRPDSQR